MSTESTWDTTNQSQVPWSLMIPNNYPMIPLQITQIKVCKGSLWLPERYWRHGHGREQFYQLGKQLIFMVIKQVKQWNFQAKQSTKGQNPLTLQHSPSPIRFVAHDKPCPVMPVSQRPFIHKHSSQINTRRGYPRLGYIRHGYTMIIAMITNSIKSVVLPVDLSTDVP